MAANPGRAPDCAKQTHKHNRANQPGWMYSGQISLPRTCRSHGAALNKIPPNSSVLGRPTHTNPGWAQGASYSSGAWQMLLPISRQRLSMFQPEQVTPHACTHNYATTLGKCSRNPGPLHTCPMHMKLKQRIRLQPPIAYLARKFDACATQRTC